MTAVQTRSPSSSLSTEPTVVIEPSKRLLHLDLKAIWEYRELLYILVWRDLKVRYKQTVIGAGWAILQPLMTMAIFTVVFGTFVKIPSDGVPYPIFAYSALLPWSLFANSLTRGGTSIVGNAHILSKIYFPRLLLPLSGILSPIVDFAISIVILVAMMIWFGTLPTWGVLALPLFLFLALLTALAVGLWLSALNVRYRDVGHAIPFLVQLWMFASPIAYPISLVPEKWRTLYMLNPMAGVIVGFRWALLGTESLDFRMIVISSIMVLALLVPGIVYFKYTERTFADVV
jgi:lipopolysaccharide transport system permease protein